MPRWSFSVALCFVAVATGVAGQSATAPRKGGNPEAVGRANPVASSLLSVTFPFLIFHAEFFQLWPLAGEPAPPVTQRT